MTMLQKLHSHSITPIPHITTAPHKYQPPHQTTSLFKLLLRTKLARMPTLPLPTVSSPRGKSGITLTANCLFAVELLGQQGQRRIVYTTTETEDQMQCGFLLDVVIAQGAAVFELLSGKDETLLIRGNSLLVLNFGLDVVDGV